MVDTNNSLMSKTLSGGRLNTLGMWQAMDSWCWKHDSVYSQVNNFDNFKIKFFPNPNNGKFTVFSNLKGQASLEIYDIVGHLIYNAVVFEGNTEMNVPLASGNYVVVFEGQKRQRRELLMVLD